MNIYIYIFSKYFAFLCLLIKKKKEFNKIDLYILYIYLS